MDEPGLVRRDRCALDRNVVLGGGGGGVSVKTASFGRSGGSDYSPTISAKVKKTPRKARVRKGVSKGKIVVKREKTL